MKIFLAITLLFFTHLVNAFVPVQATLEEMVEKSDHLLLGKVISVEMRDKDNTVIEDPKTMTGPGLENTIFLIIEVIEVYFTNVNEFPKTLSIPPDSFMHYSLGKIKEAHRNDTDSYLILLSGPDFAPPFPGRFFVNLESKERIIELHKSNK